ncbi:MAG: insulinase family protein [Oscillospiraceae bacterium]|nr:insulinase family protein [Oscillospiraceae bacterium]
MERFEYPRLGENLYKIQLSNGLTVAVVPRPGFTKKLAYFVTDFGSIHTDFTLEGREIHAPAGIAHFLEHKMFDLPGGRDVSAELAALGAGVNAFTSYDMTAYYVACTEHFEECLRLLLEFVSTPYFTDESVRKEMGIIDQEIGMNLDAPDSRVFENLMTAMYREHQIRVPILGTSDTIREITPDILYDCHRAFYTPGNMILCVVGDVDADRVAAIAEELLGAAPRPVGKKTRPRQETMDTEIQTQEMDMEVSMPTFQLGFKCEPVGGGENAIRQEIIGDLAAEALFGESSELYLKLYEDGLIDSSFGGGFETIDGMAMLLCSGDSDDPEAIQAAILARAAELAETGIEEAAFLRMKRSALGRRIRDLDSFDSTCFRVCAYHFSDFDYFRFPEIYAQVTAEEVQAFLPRVVREERCSLSIINPIEEE